MSRRDVLSGLLGGLAGTALSPEAEAQTAEPVDPSVYIPKAHLVQDRAFLHAFMREFSFIDLVTTTPTLRITHIPSGIVVSVQNERSQLQNKEMALKILKGKLLDIELEKREQERARLKGVHKEAGWGNQIRSYVLQPYQMVKDLRTGCETSQTAAVLDGELDEFIEAYLKDQVGAEVTS